MTNVIRPLPKAIEEQILQLDDEFVLAEKAGDIRRMEVIQRATWDAFPEPKHWWDSSQIVVNELIGILRDNGKAAEALQLSDEQFASGSVEDYEASPLVYRGSTMLALGRTDEARVILQDVLDKFGKRAFSGQLSGFLEFAATGRIADGLLERQMNQPNSDVLSGELPDELYEQIVSLSDAGNEMAEAGNLEGAVSSWREATELLPEPRFLWEATSWLFGSIGDVLAEMAFGGEHESRKRALITQAREAFVDALASSGGSSNPLFQMRFGQLEYELGYEESAREALLKAYMLDGEDIFEHEDARYLDLLRSKGDI